jgi:rubrerythrin
MEQHEKLIELIKTQIKIENEHVKRITEMNKKLGNAAAKLLLLEMRLDSQKHAGILTEILEILKGKPANKTLWEYHLEGYVDPFVVKRALEDHVKMETDVLAHVEEEMKHTKDEGLKLLLQHIAEDEKKHHKILETVAENMYKIKS